MMRQGSRRGLIAFLGRERVRDRARQAAAIPAMFAVLAGILAVPGIAIVQMAVSDAAEKKRWDIRGPPCPRVERPSPLATSRRRPPRTFRYGDVAFTRTFGAVECAAFRGERAYRVCQFNNPGAVTVETTMQKVTFEAAPGRRVTVRVEGGRASCVVGGWLRL